MRGILKKASKMLPKSWQEKRERKLLIKKVDEGTDHAIRVYRKTFERLAEYDRT